VQKGGDLQIPQGCAVYLFYYPYQTEDHRHKNNIVGFVADTLKGD